MILPTGWNYGLVAVSIIVAIIGSSVFLDLALRVRSTTVPVMKRVWLILGALIMGLSIWSMHFIGMLAQTMPMRVEYDAWMTALSMVAAVCGSGIAFLIIQRPVIHLLNITMGGIAMGLAIASMHYLGMASMRMQAVTVYNPYLFVLSIAIAIGASIGALWFTFYLGEKRLKGWVGKHLTGATVMGIAIAGMHYTGIAAATYVHTGSAIIDESTVPVVAGIRLSELLVWAGMVFSLALLGLSLQTSHERQKAINDLIRIQEQLKIQEAHLRTYTDSSIIGLFSWSMDGLVTDANDVFLKLIGYTQDDLNAGRIRWTELTPQDDWERDNFWIAQALSGKPVEAYEKQFIRKDGSFVDVLLGFTLLADSDTKGVAFILDNSKHKAAQRALTFEQAKLRRIVDSSYIGIVFATPYGQILDANDAFLSMIGYSRDDLLNDRIDWRAITPAEFEPQDNAKWKEIIEQGECTPFEKQYLHKEGHPIDVLLGGALLDGPEPVAIAYILDISERRRMEESLKESEQRFRSISDSSPVLIGVTDASTNATYFNKTFLDFSGMSMEELADDGWMRLLHPDDKHDYVEHYLNAFRRRLPLKAEVRFRRFDGEYRWMLAAGAPRLTENGTLLGYFGILTDITEQKETQARLENSEEHLQQMNYKLLNKNNELKDFVYAASHDLQEPLRKIMTFSQRLKTRSNGHLDLDTAQTLERIDNSARRMHELINSLLSYSRLTRESQPFVRLSLNHVVQDVLMDLEIPIREAKAQVEIEELPTISADPVQFRQLFQNLLSNALKFKRPDVSPNIRIYSRLLTGDELAAVCSFCNPQHVFHQIVVEDNGVGFESRYADQIFKIFQRLHSRNDYQGTGIGLAICRKIVERHNGYIIAQSDVGKGSRFMILLPPIPSNIQPDEDIAQPEEAVQTLEAVTG